MKRLNEFKLRYKVTGFKASCENCSHLFIDYSKFFRSGFKQSDWSNCTLYNVTEEIYYDNCSEYVCDHYEKNK